MKMKKISKLLVVLMVIALALSACGGNGNEAETGGDEPAEGGNADSGVLMMASYVAPVIDWDPSIAFSTESLVLANFYETLLRYDSEKDEFIPILATDYETSDDGLTWTFTIREGVKFHDGSDMTTDDVVYSLNRSKDIAKGASFIWDPVSEIKATGDWTVEMTLDYPAPLDLIVSCAYSAYVFSEAVVEGNGGTDWFQEGNEIGTAPYMLQSQVPDDEVVMEKFEEYWGGWDGNHFSKVLVKNVGENASRRMMIEKGEADLTNSLMVEDYIELQDSDTVTVYNSSSFANTIGFWNTQHPPFDNVNVRKALNYAFPYDEVVTNVSKGFATLGTGPIPVSMWGSVEDPPYTFDMDKAKELLTEAGYPDGGFDMTLTYISGVEDRKKSAELFKANLEELGVNVEIVGLPWEQMWEKAKSTKPEDRQDWLSIAWWPDVVTPASWFKALYYTEPDEIFWNLAYYSNPDLDKLIDEADVLSGTDRDAAAKAYQDCANILAEDAVSTYITDGTSTYVIQNTLQNFSEDPAYPYVLFFYDFYREG